MSSLEQREQNLLNATEVMAQFYDEIESFLTILYTEMEREGFTAKTERLRSGTFTVKNLSRRLLASISIMYIKDTAPLEDTEDIEDEDESLDEAEEKSGKDTDVAVHRQTIIPLLTLYLFKPRTIPTAHTLSSPELVIGAISDIEFVDKKTDKPSQAASHAIGLSNLGQIFLKPDSKVGNTLGISCRKPKSIRKFKLRAKVIQVEKLRLLEIDSQEKIKEIARKLSGFCDANVKQGNG